VIYIDDESLIGGKSPAKAGLSLQEEPSNVTFTFDEYETSVKIGCRCGRDGPNSVIPAMSPARPLFPRKMG
jgi:hypothetical protein